MGYWDLADNMISDTGYWHANPSGANYWTIPLGEDQDAIQQMIEMDMAAASMEGVFDAGAAQATEQEKGLSPIEMRNGMLTIQLNATTSVQIFIPEEARSFVQSTIGDLASNLAEEMEKQWGMMLNEGGADIDEFVWWPPLKPSTIKNKEQQYGMTPEKAKIPNLRTGDTARKMQAHAWGMPTLEETDRGLVVSWGPTYGQQSSHEDLKYREMYQGSGFGTPNPASGRSFHTMRPPRPFGFVPAMRSAFDQILRDWIQEINNAETQLLAGSKTINVNSIAWVM